MSDIDPLDPFFAKALCAMKGLDYDEYVGAFHLCDGIARLGRWMVICRLAKSADETFQTLWSHFMNYWGDQLDSAYWECPKCGCFSLIGTAQCHYCHYVRSVPCAEENSE